MLRSNGSYVVLILLLAFLGDWRAFTSVGRGHAAPEDQSLTPDHIVISEFRTRGPNGGHDEFIELSNPMDEPIAIGGWRIFASNESGTPDLRAIVPAEVVLKPGQHTLLVKGRKYGYSGFVASDQAFSDGINDAGGIAVANFERTVVDQVGMSADSAFKGGGPLPPLTTNADHSYERLAGVFSAPGCFDAGNNLSDFVTRAPGDPQNSFSAHTACEALQSGPATDTPTDTETPTQTDTPLPTDTATSIPTPTPSPSPTGTPSPTESPTSSNTPTPSSTPTVTKTPSAPNHVVISEFRTRGYNGDFDEFVELYNPTGGMVNIGSWKIKKSACGGNVSIVATIPPGSLLDPGQHYLIAGSGASFTGSDLVYTANSTTTTLADDDGIGLTDSTGAVIDRVGLCSSDYYLEGAPLTPFNPADDAIDQSYERKPAGAANCYDTGNNAADFSIRSPSDPLNSGAPLVMCNDVLTFTPTFTATISPTRTTSPTRTRTPSPTTSLTYTPSLSRTATRTRTPTRSRTPTNPPTPYRSVIVLNEFLPHPRSDWNGDGQVNVNDEYIEIINIGTVPVNVKGWKLDNGVGGPSPSYTLPDQTLLPRQIVRFFRSQTGVALSDGGSSVRLVSNTGLIADAYTYPIVEAADRTWCRLPDGSGAWSFDCFPTPGRPSVRFSASAQATPAAPGAGFSTGCVLSDSVPEPIQEAECDGPGGGIWMQKEAGGIWIRGRWKWDVYIQ